MGSNTELLAQFLRDHPGVDFRLTIHNREQILDQLHAFIEMASNESIKSRRR